MLGAGAFRLSLRKRSRFAIRGRTCGACWLTILFSLRQMKRDHRAYAPGYKAYSDFRLFWGTRFFSVVTARSERSHPAVAGREGMNGCLKGMKWIAPL